MISVILLILAGIFNACMDTLKTHYSISIFSRWKNQDWVNPSLSWTNKWKPKSKIGDLIMSTVLVWTTDLWHLCKHLMLTCIMFALVFYNPLVNWWVDLLIMYCSFTIPFEIFYSKVLVLKNK
jgi:hypothetical protein